MTMALNSAVVRIRMADGTVVGAGFLVGQRQVLTCAHVIAQALHVSEDAPQVPQAEVHLDFPLIAPGRIVTAHIIHWQPQSDVAGLELDGAPPAGVETARLLKPDDVWGHSFRAFGFPPGYDDGVWASGVLLGQTAAGWVQIEDVKEPGYRVQPGFSGTPVWDDQLSGTVGMAVAADTDRMTKAAFVIPADLLIKAWPALAEQSLDAGSLEHLTAQLTMFQTAQHTAPDPRRFQPKIDELQAAISSWDNRVESQQQRITAGLEVQRQQLAEEVARHHGRERLQVVGRPPLDVADYFKNRQRELATVGRLLAEPTTRLVSIIGHGGIGKTALACKVLQDLERHRWPHTEEDVPLSGIVYLSTRTAGISLERLFLDCAKLLGDEQERHLNAVWTNPQIGTEDKIPRLLEALSDGQYVILLDNIEDLLDDTGQFLDENLRLFFEHRLTTAHGARLLVTSRISLVFQPEVMRFDRQVKLLEGLPIPDGVALLRELDPNGDYGLRDAPEQQLAEAVELTHGVPRALEVIAGILANDPFASLDDVLERFYEQQDVAHALIEENYKRLDRDARQVIEALAVFRRPVPSLAVDYLLEPFAPGLDVPGIIRRLTRANIVSVDRATKTVTLHPIDQDYAYSQLPEERSNESAYTRQALERRAADYYVQLRTPPETWKGIDDLEPQLAEFDHRVRAGDYDDACRVLEPIDSEYLYRWGHYARLAEMRRELLGHLVDPIQQVHNLSNLGCAYHALGQVEQAVELNERALSVVHEIGDRQEGAIVLVNLGKAYHSLGSFKRAVKLYEDALNMARESSSRQVEGQCLSNLGLSHYSLGQIEPAIELCEAALAIAREIKDRSLEGKTLATMGSAYRTSGRIERAIKFCEAALAIAREIKDRWVEVISLGDLGLANCAVGRIDRAIQLYEEAMETAREICDRRKEGTWLGGLGGAYRALGQTERAIELHEEALDIARETGERRSEGIWLDSLGSDYCALGQIEKAIQFHQEALVIARKIGHRRGESYRLLGLGRALLVNGELPKAGEYCAEALALNEPGVNCQAALTLAIVLLHEHDPSTEDTFADAITRCQHLLDKTTRWYEPHYALAAALVGKAVCNPRWVDRGERARLLAPSLEEYQKALEITAAPGVVRDAVRDLEMIRAAGVDGLEPAFELLESALV